MLVRAGLLLALLVATGACGDDQEAMAPAPVAPRPRAPLGDEPAVARHSNAPPRIDAIEFEPERLIAGGTVRAVVQASDPDGDNLWFHYAWTIDGLPARSGTAELSLNVASRGDSVEVTVVAHDGAKESDPARESATLENAPPRLVRVEILPAGELVAGAPVIVRPEARDADGDPLTLHYEWTVNNRRQLEKGPSLDTKSLRRGDKVVVKIVASDGEDESEPFVSPTMEVANTPPRIVSKPGRPSADGVFRYRVAAEDPDGDPGLQFHLEKAPEGMEIDSMSGAIQWVPRRDQAGVHTVSVIADDLRGGRSRQRFEVTVGAPAAPPAAADG